MSPFKPKVPCKYPLCPAVIEPGQQYCDKHKQSKPVEDYRESANKRGYNGRWQKARATYLRSHPLCVECLKNGDVVSASVVDHVEPHRGDYRLFWTESNWQSLCKMHHDRKTGKGK